MNRVAGVTASWVARLSHKGEQSGGMDKVSTSGALSPEAHPKLAGLHGIGPRSPSSLGVRTNAQPVQFLMARRSGGGDAGDRARDILQGAEDKLDKSYLEALNKGLPPDEAAKEAIEKLGQDDAQVVLAPGDAAVGLDSEGVLQRSKRMLGDARRTLSNAAGAIADRLPMQPRYA